MSVLGTEHCALIVIRVHNMARGEDSEKSRSAKSTGFVESTDGSDRRTGIPWVDPRPGDASRGTGLGPEITELVVATVVVLPFFSSR